ncbi:MAG TPA: PSD1 and planctomycete cytochrome C domain-containing protein [Gemmataceae bacterium]|nr:PSD1 and planctomycete cytochrome C domain-containing protein [Gemmataceae bacterium]
MKRSGSSPAILMLLLLVGVSVPVQAAEPEAAKQTKFFETQVRPILQAHCLACHGGEKKVKGGLRLTSRENLLKGGNSGPAVSQEKPHESLLLQAINYQDLKMPPKGKLGKGQIDILTRWVKMGVPWAAGGAEIAVKRSGPPPVDDQARRFWSFQPVKRPPVPAVQNKTWVRTPIDAFVLAKIEAAGLQPAPPADKVGLLRRVHYAVTGLPPTPDEVKAFLADDAPDAYEKVVDKLLASRQYAEHWARHWLDLVRYAETNSFERDAAKPFVWRYRDYVIRSFNQDKPYDRFLREQLAGDELDDVTPESIIATGYYRLGTWDDEPVDRTQAYYDELDDVVATTGQVFLGLTVNCARCHDHKIDPFPQRDYYRLLAFFHGIRRYGNGADSLRSIGDGNEHDPRLANYRTRLADLDRQMAAIEQSVLPRLSGGERDDFKRETSRAVILKKHVPGLVDSKSYGRYTALQKQREGLRNNPPAAAALTLCVAEEGSYAKDTFVFLRGSPQSHGAKVEPGFPAVLVAPGAPELKIPLPSKDARTSGRRRMLANWLADARNPLTARVIVNRVWQYVFGRGIVRSANDFGYQGSPPTHPELLDWLASEFVAGGWQLKPLQRLLLTSNAFRMSSNADPAVLTKDPENDLLARFGIRRLTAEELRDSILAVSGDLNLNKTEGPSVYPVIPREVLAGQSMPGNGWGRSTPQEAAARSIFVHVKRSLAVPILNAFDAADTDATCPVRFTTTQPTQALAMINGEFVNSQARSFAGSLHQHAGTETTGQVRTALWRVLQRPPAQIEINRGVRFLTEMHDKDNLSQEEALRRFCLLALNLNEFVFLH